MLISQLSCEIEILAHALNKGFGEMVEKGVVGGVKIGSTPLQCILEGYVSGKTHR